MRYNVFIRTWWRKATRPGFPGNREPHMGRKSYMARGVSREEAKSLCEHYNSTHEPGRFSLKAEFEAA